MIRIRCLIVLALALFAGLAGSMVSAQAAIDFAAGTGAGTIKAAHSGLCLAVPGANPADTVVVVQQVCTGAPEQIWAAQAMGGGRYHLVNQATGGCMDSQTRTDNGSAVWQIHCLNVSQQMWSGQAQSSGFRLVAAYSGKCLDVGGVSMAAGAPLDQWDCVNVPQQTFSSTTAGSAIDFAAGTGAGMIKAAHSGLCLAVPGANPADTVVVVQQVCTGAPEQIWAAQAMGGGRYHLVNQATGGCMDSQMRTDNGSAVWQIHCLNVSQQMWSGQAQSSGFRLVAAYSGKCLDVGGVSMAAGAPLDQWDCVNVPQQTFSSTAAGTATSTAAGTATSTATSTAASTATGTAASTATGTAASTATGTAASTAAGTATSTASGTATSTASGSAIDFAAGTGAGMIKAAHSGLCLAIPGANPADTVVVVQQVCTGAPEQIWAAQAMGGGRYHLVNQATGGCMDSQMRTDNGSAVWQIHCLNVSQQMWSGQAQSSGFRLVAAYSGKCLDVGGVSMTAGAPLDQWDCVNVPQQTFSSTAAGTATSAAAGTAASTGNATANNATSSANPSGDAAPSGPVLMIDRQSGKCVQVPDGIANSGEHLNQLTCDGRASQSWTFTAVSGGYQIRNGSSNQCVFVDRGLTNAGPSLLQMDCSTSGAGGLWTLKKVGSLYQMTATHSGLCGTVTSGSRDDGAELSQQSCDGSDPSLFTIMSSTILPSAWTPPRTLGIVPVSAAPLPNGKLLMWSADSRNTFDFGSNTWTTLYDPATDTETDLNIVNTGQMFCPGTSVLSDGRILINGGRSPSNTTIYDPATNTWTASGTMNIPRGYNGNTTLSTGEVLTYGGSWSGGTGDKFAEVWSPLTGNWRVLGNVSGNAAATDYPKNEVFRDNHYWLFAVDNGWVFNAGPSTNMFWIDTRGNGALTAAGNRADDVWSQSGTATMYDIGKVLKLGGASGGQNEAANDNAYVIDITAGAGNPVGVTKLDTMPFRRVFLNSVVLPTGDVVDIGGQNIQANFTDDRSVMMTDIWSPKTGKFSLLAPLTVPRNYHSWAVLMPDGRIAAGGGGLCGCSGDHWDFQFLTPPYLYNAAGGLAARPTITAAPYSVSAGATFAVTTDRSVASFALVRLSATTHTVNSDQRRIPLAITASNGASYQVKVPNTLGALLPGNWMLFAMDANNVPSVSKIVKVY